MYSLHPQAVKERKQRAKEREHERERGMSRTNSHVLGKKLSAADGGQLLTAQGGDDTGRDLVRPGSYQGRRVGVLLSAGALGMPPTPTSRSTAVAADDDEGSHEGQTRKPKSRLSFGGWGGKKEKDEGKAAPGKLHFDVNTVDHNAEDTDSRERGRSQSGVDIQMRVSASKSIAEF